MFAYYELVIRTFLNRSIDNDWLLPIYYLRHKRQQKLGTQRSFFEKDVNEELDTINKQIKNIIKNFCNSDKKTSDKKTDDATIGNCFLKMRNSIINKKHPMGAYAIKIYNGGGASKDEYNINNNNDCSTYEKSGEDECIGHLEIRLHHSTDDFAEIHNWILLMNLFLSSCIQNIDNLVNIADNDAEFDTKINEQIPDFPTDNDGSTINYLAMFDDFFDNYIKNNTLKKFYRNKSTDKAIKNSSKESTTLIHLHTPHIFDDSGAMKKEGPLIDLMTNFNIDVSKLS